MVRNNTTLVALCAIVLSLVAVNDSWGIDNQDIYDWFLGNPNEWEYTPPVNEDDFEGNIIFPPPYDDGWGYLVGDCHLPDGTYTLNLTDGRTFTFTGSLIIQETEYEEDETVGIGRIQVLGEAPGVGQGMVMLDEAVLEEGWGGILVTTFPDGDNEISYCEITNVDAQAWLTGIQIGTGVTAGQCVVESSHIHGCSGNGIFVSSLQNNGNDYSISSNLVHDNGFRGIQIEGAFDGANPGLAVVNNVIYDNTNDGIELHNTFDWIGITNNIVYGNADDENGVAQIFLDTAVDNPRIHNNVLDGQDIEDKAGISVVGNWTDEIRNNIIVNCAVGIQNFANDVQDPTYHSSLLNNPETVNNPDAENDEGCEPDGLCILDDDPEFVDDDDPDFDLHLLWTSPAINTGNPDEDYNDPDGSDNDMGAYGGPNADPEMRSRFFGTAIQGEHHVETTGTVERQYTYVINNGTTFEFDPGSGISVGGLLEVNGIQGNPVSFQGFDGDIERNRCAAVGA